MLTFDAKTSRARHRHARGAAVAFAGLIAVSCSRSITSSVSLLDPEWPRSASPTVSISSAGVQPDLLHLDAPVTVTVTNNDGAAHRLEPAPELGYGRCAEIEQLGTLQPGESAKVTIERRRGHLRLPRLGGAREPELPGLHRRSLTPMLDIPRPGRTSRQRLPPWGTALRVLVSATVALALASPLASACDSTSCSLLTRGENVLVPKKKFRLDLSFGYTDESVLLSGSREVDTVLRPRVLLEAKRILPDFHSDIDGFDRVLQMDVTYGLGSRVNLQASVPLTIWQAHEVSHGNFRGEYGTQGIGDTLVGARFALRPRRLVAGFAVKVPTGDHEVGGEFGGGIQDPVLQPGTGAFDFVGSLQYGWRIESLGLNASVAGSYQLTTTNDLDYRFGNQAIATVGVARPLVGRLAASLQAKLYHQGRNQYLGMGVPSTGGTFVYLNPGVRVSAAKGFSLYAFLLLVPYRHVNEAQLAPRIGVLTGVSKLF